LMGFASLARDIAKDAVREAPAFKDKLLKEKDKVITSVYEASRELTKDAKAALVRDMDSAMTTNDNNRLNWLLDAALSNRLWDSNPPQVLVRCAQKVARRQLQDAMDKGDPKLLQGALVSAKRLNATEIPEFEGAVAKYRAIRKFPPGWDVTKMVHQRKGKTLMAKSVLEDPATLAKFQNLLELTHRKVYTRDRRKEKVPDRLEVVKVINIENGDLWVDYMARQETIRQEIAGDKGYDIVRHEVDTSKAGLEELLPADMRLDPAVNEVFLFHGTSHIAADKITTTNFRINLAGSNAGTLYGRGIYMAENCTKSDEYTMADKTGLRTLVVCRATLGRTYYLDAEETNPRDCEDACLRGRFHSVLGDRKKCKGTFREFIVFNDEQVYPNYILTYRRCYE